MYTRTITYTDWNGMERTEEFRFNLTKAELMEMQYEQEGGMREYLQKIIDSKNQKEIMRMFKDLVLKAYGEKSDDGKHFIKNDAVRERFASTPVYSDLFMELSTDANAAATFVNGIMPADIDRAALNAKPGKAPIEVAAPTE